MTDGVVLNGALRKSILAINRAQASVDNTSTRLATNQRVNSALDNPQNYFLSQALTNRSNDLSRLIDGINQSIFTIKEALTGAKAIERLLNQAEAVALESLALQRAGLEDPNIVNETVNTSSATLSSQILSSNPEGYWRLNETAGAAAANLGTGGGALNGTYVNGPSLGDPELYNNGGDVAPTFNGTNQYVAIPDSNLINLQTYPERSIEMVFNANDTTGRQVLYEEGATVNSFTIYIDNGRLYATGRDSGAWGPANISVPINANQTYHVAFTFDQPNDSFDVYVDGANIGSVSVNNTVFPSHSGNIAIGGTQDGTWFHDGSTGSAGFFFDGQISDLAIYNAVLTPGEIQARADSLTTSISTEFVHTEFELIMDQIDQIVEDANYRGINLLGDETLRTDFNEDRSNYLRTEGQDFTVGGLGLKRSDFNNLNDLEAIIDRVREALKQVRQFGFTLTNDLSVIQTRDDFTRKVVNTLDAGSTDLTIADLNEESANLLASQTRLAMAYEALNLAGQSNDTILDIVTGNPQNPTEI